MPTEVQQAMAQLAQMRNDAISAQQAAQLRVPVPTFTPSFADAVFGGVAKPTPEERLEETLFPGRAAREKLQAAQALLAATTGTPSAPVPPFGPAVRPPEPTHRMTFTLPMQATSGRDAQGNWPSAPKPDEPIADELLKNRGNFGAVIDEALTKAWTGAMYLQWVRMAQYPWWWGPITGGLLQVEAMLIRDNADWQRSWLPDVTKGIFSNNVSKALTWVREQRALAAARAGGTPVAV